MTSPMPFLRPTPAADNAVGRPGYEKAALCWAPEAGLVTLLLCLMSVIYSEPELSSRGAFTRAGAAEEQRNGVEAEKLIASAFFVVVVFQSAICICSFVFSTRKGRSFLSPLHPSPPPTAAKCLKYLTGFALFLGLCSVCGGAYVMEFQLTLLCSKKTRCRPHDVCSHIVWTLSAKGKAGISAPSVL